MLHQCCRALKMLSFGISYKPMCLTFISDKKNQYGRLVSPVLRVCSDFEHLDFLYENATPFL